jgi:hypothetical protein
VIPYSNPNRALAVHNKVHGSRLQENGKRLADLGRIKPLTPDLLPMRCILQFDFAWGEGVSRVGLRAAAHMPLMRFTFQSNDRVVRIQSHKHCVARHAAPNPRAQRALPRPTPQFSLKVLRVGRGAGVRGSLPSEVKWQRSTCTGFRPSPHFIINGHAPNRAAVCPGERSLSSCDNTRKPRVRSAAVARNPAAVDVPASDWLLHLP